MIYLPLEHLEQRYTTYFDRDICNYLQKNDIKYRYIAPNTLSNKIVHGSFLDANSTVYRQFNQLCEVIKLLANGEIDKNETIFTTDIWNFALMCIPYINYFTESNIKVQGVLHAGSFTDTDFVRQMERVYKGFEESIFDICDKIFVASNFIKNDVIQKRYVQPQKIEVTGIPLDWEKIASYNCSHKENIIVFNGRNVDEKQPHLFDLLQTRLPQYRYVNTQKLKLSKPDYYELLSRAKCVVSFALQENFGIGVQEAVAFGCIPVVPNRLVYVEQFEKIYRYNDFYDCVSKVDSAMKGELPQTKPTYNNNDIIFEKWFRDFVDHH